MQTFNFFYGVDIRVREAVRGKSSPQMADGAANLHSTAESEEKSRKNDDVATKRPRRRTEVELQM